jgi:RNA polymerase subunit RPABC4/transcription elongation factor Spt4
VEHDEDFICPVCGAEVPAGARACPECGSDERTGWSDQTIYDDTGITDPDEDEFKHEEWLRREGVLSPKRPARQWLWWGIALLVLLAILFQYVW